MQNDLFEKAPVHKAYFSFALPVVFSMVISVIYNMADTYFIAGTGNTNLVAGVSLGAPIFTLMIALGDIFGLGGSSVISRLFGQKKDEDGKRLSVFCFYGAIVCGVIVAAVMMIFRAPILQVLGADSDTIVYASQYYTWLVLGAPFIILVYTPSNLLRTEGFAVGSMTGTVLGAVVNIILDPIFISVLGMGAAGAAIATVIGNICTDIFYIIFLLTKSKRLSVNLKGFHISGKELGDIFAIGIPASVTNFMQSFGIALMNRFLLTYGNEKVAAMGIVMKINMIAMLILVGFAFGSQPLIGYNYGAGESKRVKEIFRSALFLIVIVMVIGTILCMAVPQALIGLFTGNPETIRLGREALRLISIGFIVSSVSVTVSGALEGLGKGKESLVISLLRYIVVILPLAFILSRLFQAAGVWHAFWITEFVSAVISWIICKKEIFQ